MIKEQLKKLYSQVENIAQQNPTPTQLMHICLGYSHLYHSFLAQPNAADACSDKNSIYRNLQESADRLIASLNAPQSTDDEKVGYIVSLLDSYQTPSDIARLDTVFDAAYGLVEPSNGRNTIAQTQPASYCELLCCLHYFIPQDGHDIQAAVIIDRWCKHQNSNGSWEITGREGIKRIEALAKFGTVINERYDVNTDKGIRYYIDNTIAPNPSNFFPQEIETIAALVNAVINAGTLQKYQDAVTPIVKSLAEIGETSSDATVQAICFHTLANYHAGKVFYTEQISVSDDHKE